MHPRKKIVSKAIIAVAGWGTRRLPITKAVEKCMLPILDRPVVDYAVEQCIAAGITDIYFVVSPEFGQLRAYYSRNLALEKYLKDRGRGELAGQLQTISSKANFHYIVQDPTGPYGTAVPVWLARESVIQDDYFVVLCGDGFVYHKDRQQNDVNDLINSLVVLPDASGAVLGLRVDRDKKSRFPVIEVSGESPLRFERIIEKPDLNQITSPFMNVSYYLLSPGVFEHIKHTLQSPNEAGEHYLTDAVSNLASAGQNLLMVESNGEYLDAGNTKEWLRANEIISRSTWPQDYNLLR